MLKSYKTVLKKCKLYNNEQMEKITTSIKENQILKQKTKLNKKKQKNNNNRYIPS